MLAPDDLLLLGGYYIGHLQTEALDHAPENIEGILGSQPDGGFHARLLVVVLDDGAHVLYLGGFLELPVGAPVDY